MLPSNSPGVAPLAALALAALLGGHLAQGGTGRLNLGGYRRQHGIGACRGHVFFGHAPTTVMPLLSDFGLSRHQQLEQHALN